jgi:hypothetical protein
MKNNITEEYYVKYLKESLVNKRVLAPKENVKNDKKTTGDILKKNFEKQEQRLYSNNY